MPNHLRTKRSRKIQRRGSKPHETSSAHLSHEHSSVSTDNIDFAAPELSPQVIPNLQSVIGNKQTTQLARRTPQPARATLPPIGGIAPAGTRMVYRKVGAPRATIQRDPISGAIKPYVVDLAKRAKNVGPALKTMLNDAEANVGDKVGKLKKKVNEKVEPLKEKGKKFLYGEDNPEQEQPENVFEKSKKEDKGFFGYTFGTDFTYQENIMDNIQDLPPEMAALQMQMALVGQQEQVQMTAYRQSKGDERRKNFAVLQEVLQKKQELQDKLANFMKQYGSIQKASIEDMQKTVLSNLPEDVVAAAKQRWLNPRSTKPQVMQQLMDLYEEMHPIEFRKAELEARQDSFKNVDTAFLPMRQTAEGQLLSDVKKQFTQDSLDEQSMDYAKKKKKESTKEGRYKAKLGLGEKSKSGQKVSDKEREEANDFKGKAPWETVTDTDKITEDADKASEILGGISKGTKVVGKGVVAPIVGQATGGTQDDEGLLSAIPTLPALGAEVADLAGSIQLITDGNSAQKQLGIKKLKDGIFGVFGGMGKVVKTTLKSVEQFQLGEAVEKTSSTAVGDLGIPIVGIITSGASVVKAGIDIGLQANTAHTYSTQKSNAKKDSQSKALVGALRHGKTRAGELIGSAIGEAVSSGLMLAANIMELTGVGALPGQIVRMLSYGIKGAQKVGEKLRDSYRTGKALESQYKAKVGAKGSENEVFENSPKYAATALLRRAMDGDSVALKTVKAHGIGKTMIADIKAGKVLFAQARDLIYHDWKEKENSKTIGMTVKEGLDKVKGALAKLLDDDKEEAPERREMNIQHGAYGPAQQEDFDNPTDYEAPKRKKGFLEKVKETGSSIGKKLKGIPKKITGVPGKIGDAMGKTYSYSMKLPVVKWQFIKVVKDAVQYGGEIRKGNWVVNRVLSSDSDVDEQFAHVKQMLGDNQLWAKDQATQVALVQQMLDIMQTELSLKQKYKIKPEKEKTKEYYQY
jgi:hypothetical protein